MTDHLTARLAENDQLAGEATEGPWEAEPTRRLSNGALIEAAESELLRIEGEGKWQSLGTIDSPSDRDLILRARTELPALNAAVRAALRACEDMQANGNSRELGDPAAETWIKSAGMVRQAIYDAMGEE